MKSLKPWLDNMTGCSMNCLTESTTKPKEATDCHLKQEASDGNFLWQIKTFLVSKKCTKSSALNKIYYLSVLVFTVFFRQLVLLFPHST